MLSAAEGDPFTQRRPGAESPREAPGPPHPFAALDPDEREARFSSHLADAAAIVGAERSFLGEAAPVSGVRTGAGPAAVIDGVRFWPGPGPERRHGYGVRLAALPWRLAATGPASRVSGAELAAAVAERAGLALAIDGVPVDTRGAVARVEARIPGFAAALARDVAPWA